MKKTMKYAGLLACVVLFATACKKDKDKPTTSPEVTTAAATDITTSAAKAGGTIIADGNSTVTEAGVVYSATNQTPTLSDSKVAATENGGSFTVALTSLQGGKTYYIRAYATNGVGTGYGAVMTFMTGNAAPEAKNVKIEGNLSVAGVLTSSYAYADNESDPEGSSTYKWYSANDSIGAPASPISGATGKTYTVTAAEKDKFIYVGVTPVATSGTTPGAEVKSKWYGPIGGETVTFTYNGKTVIYGVIKSSVTGRKWMDRNLGAAHASTDYSIDHQSKGDLFQWGRRADGHQLINRGATDAETSAVNSVTTALSDNDIPPNPLFIKIAPPTADWRIPHNNDLWQAPNFTNSPCPSGWHVPTMDEWSAEKLNGKSDDAYSKLRLTATGYRQCSNGNIAKTESFGCYWSATVETLPSPYNDVISYAVYLGPGQPGLMDDFKAQGLACRCIKNE